MTYIVGMVCDDGVVIASDGLARQFDNAQNKWIPPRHDAYKTFPLTDYVCVALAGVVYEIEDFIKNYRLNYMQPYLSHPDQPKNIKVIAEHFGGAVATQFEQAAKQHNKDLEVLIGGYDTLNDKATGLPQLYLYRRFITKNEGASLYPVRGIVDAGYSNGVYEWVVDRYENGNKGFKALRRLSAQAIRKSAGLYPDDVGGNISMYHVTKRGTERCRTLKV